MEYCLGNSKPMSIVRN